MVRILNWFSLHISVVAFGYLLNGLNGALLAPVCLELLKLGANVLLEPKLPKQN